MFNSRPTVQYCIQIFFSYFSERNFNVIWSKDNNKSIRISMLSMNIGI